MPLSPIARLCVKDHLAVLGDPLLPNYPCAGSKLSPCHRIERTHEGQLPLVLRRTYRTLDPTVGRCGVGWRHRYEHFVRAVNADRPS